MDDRADRHTDDRDWLPTWTKRDASSTRRKRLITLKNHVFPISVDEDHCHPNPCEHGGVCIAKGASYECHCPIHWTGINCESRSSFLHILYEQGRSLQVQSIIKLWEQKLLNSVNHYKREILSKINSSDAKLKQTLVTCPLLFSRIVNGFSLSLWVVIGSALAASDA